MILIVLAVLCVLSVPLTGGRLSRLGDLRIRGLWIPAPALAAQVVITTLVRDGQPALHAGIHIATYVLLGVFLWVNRRLPGVVILAAGTLMNTLAIVLNGGVMPSAAAAERIAGLSTEGGFRNSAHLAHPVLLWFGDIIPWPGPLPNVLSVGDCLIFAGTLVLLHRSCRAAPGARGRWRERFAARRAPDAV